MKFPKKTGDRGSKPVAPKLRIPKSDAIKSKKGTPDLEPRKLSKGKASASREVALLASTPEEASLALEVLNSRFGKQTKTIVDLIDMGNSDGASSLIVKALLQSLVEILPMAENNIRETRATKGIYGFNTLLTSMRDLLGDLQSLRDRANVGQSIVDKTVRPSYMDIATQIVASFTLMQDSAKSRMSDEDFKEFRVTVETSKKGLSDYMLLQYKNVADQVIKSLS